MAVRLKLEPGFCCMGVLVVLLLGACGSRTDPLDEYGLSGTGGGGGVDCSGCPTAVYDGSVTLDFQADADAMAQYGSITGSLSIPETSGVSNLDGLQCITSIEKAVAIRGRSVGDVQGLACLESVGRAFKIENISGLQNVDGLERLTSIGLDLMLRELSGLQNVDGLKGVRSVGRNVTVVNVPNLPTCEAKALGDQLVDLGGSVVVKGTLPDECGP